ncbi:MAG: hypothetical protein AM326_04370 [Candidatus Thorarchaeota archaeon SMTZ-45]|nr:MAG: hypothetical protein AM326_04370 [Candidatus Thorarchaeota archaeon SMTZ-45]
MASDRNRILMVLLRMGRIILFAFGIFTTFWFFFSFIGLFIGIGCFFAFRESSWSQHGIVLAFAAGTATLLAHVVKSVAPLTMAIMSSIAILVLYSISSTILWIWHRLERTTPSMISELQAAMKTVPMNLRRLLILVIIFSPVLMWSSVSIDLGVMFDNRARLLWVHAPSTVITSASFEITVEAWDPYERLSATYKGTVQFSILSYNLTSFNQIDNSSVTLPSPYTFTGQNFGSDIAYEIQDGKDNGRHIFTVTIETPGIHYILVEDSSTGNTYYSNPIVAKTASELSTMIYWGDIHNHSELSDGTGSAAHSFFYGRYIACLDFMSLTDHGEIMLFGPSSFDVLENATNAAYAPHQFVTFHGLEWTNTDTGHYTCIFSGDELLKDPILSYLTLPTTDLLWNTLDELTAATSCRVLALPHHTTQKQYLQDWTYINPKYVKIVEVTSVHGECLFEQRHPLNYVGLIAPPPEYTNGTSIIDAFRMGYRMTIYASSDQHDGHPGHSISHTPAFVGHQRPFSVWHTRNEHPYPGGLTAVYATELTRDSIFSAIERQVIYACSDHGRPLLNFTINGVSVGDGSTLYVASPSTLREIEITLAQDGSPAAAFHSAASVTDNWFPNWNAQIEIIKNGELLTRIGINQPLVNITYIDSETITGTSYGSESCILVNGQYYINGYSNNPIDPDTLNTSGADFYLVRIVGANGRYAYIGPIWVEVNS